LESLEAAPPDGEAADALYEALGPGSADESDVKPAGQLFDGALSPFTDTIWSRPRSTTLCGL